MAIVEQHNFKSWSELTHSLDESFRCYQDYIFRGQADKDWKLEPTITREINSIYPRKIDKKKLLKFILYSFKKNIRGRCSIDLDSAKDEEVWALGQHYGLYTPLLDWTRSPYVAVYFSLFGESKTGIRSIYALSQSDVDGFYTTQPIVADEDKIKIIEPLTHYNARLVSQRGLFLYVPPSASIEEQVEKLKIEKHVVMYKVNFPDSIKKEALAALNLMNINSASLFPDIQGAAMQSNYEFSAEKYFEEMREQDWR